MPPVAPSATEDVWRGQPTCLPPLVSFPVVIFPLDFLFCPSVTSPCLSPPLPPKQPTNLTSICRLKEQPPTFEYDDRFEKRQRTTQGQLHGQDQIKLSQ
jgi:hypothetical protein